VLNDLVLWEPVAPAPLDVNEPYSLSNRGPGWSIDTLAPFMEHQSPELFSVCKSGIQYGESTLECGN
jgi:hypothetical protein